MRNTELNQGFKLSKCPPEQLAMFLIFAISGSMISAALVMEYALGYKPCELCYVQRWGHYVAIGATFIGLVFTAKPRVKTHSIWLIIALFGLAHAAGYAIYHSGVEFSLLEGPTACSGAEALNANNLDQLDLFNEESKETLVRCDVPALYIFGLSLAVWNMIITTLLLGLGLLLTYKGRKP